MAPDTAGPMTKPKPKEHMMMDIPRAWLLSFDDSEMIAFTVPTTPDAE